MKGRFGQSDVVEGCIFQGSIGYFKELDPPEDGKRFDYDRVLRMDYLFEEFDNQQKKKEELRQQKYTEYIEEKRQTIKNEMEKQKQALLENNITLDECAKIVLNRKRNLWEREIDQSDFLNLRIGIGNINFNGK